MKKRSLFFSLCLCLLLTACGAGGQESIVMRADYPYYSSAQDAVDVADLVFSGTVQSWTHEELVISDEGTPYPYTVYQVTADTIYKGEWEEGDVPIKIMGGELDGTRYVLDGAPELQVGEKYLFAVSVYPNSYPSLINLDQSVFPMDPAVDPVDMAGEGNVTLREMLACFD